MSQVIVAALSVIGTLTGVIALLMQIVDKAAEKREELRASLIDIDVVDDTLFALSVALLNDGKRTIHVHSITLSTELPDSVLSPGAKDWADKYELVPVMENLELFDAAGKLKELGPEKAEEIQSRLITIESMELVRSNPVMVIWTLKDNYIVDVTSRVPNAGHLIQRAKVNRDRARAVQRS